jgi:hypothetical protein
MQMRPSTRPNGAAATGFTPAKAENPGMRRRHPPLS